MSMKKPSEKTFKIDEIKPIKNAIVLVINGDSFTISKSVFTDDYYYPDKVLSENEMMAIKKADHLLKAQQYLDKTITSKRYTEKEITDKLKTKFKLSKNDIFTLLKPYLDANIISDKDYALDYLEAKSSSGYGMNYITEQLKKKGIDLDIVSSEDINKFNNLSINICKQLLRKKDQPSKPLLKRKEILTDFLYRRGFNKEEVNEMINDYFSSDESRFNNDESYGKRLEQIADKAYLSLSKSENDLYKRKNKFIKKILNNGYSLKEVYDIIAKKGYFTND